MPCFSRAALLNFLSEPRCLDEVVKHFGISPSLARRILKEGLEQDQVLVCTRARTRDTLFYVARDSRLFAEHLTGFAAEKAVRAQKTIRAEDSLVDFSSKIPHKSNFSSTAEDAWAPSDHKPKRRSFPKVKTKRERLVKSTQSPSLRKPRQPPTTSQAQSFPLSRKMSMFAALACQPRSYMDLHASFNVSKNTIETLSNKGYVEEVWGPRNIGVKFQLTEKGKRHLERLRLAAKLKKDEMEKAAIRLKRIGP